MAPPVHASSIRAGGTIRTSRFITMSTTDNTAVESNAADEAILGISGENAQDAPIPGASANAAESGDHFTYHPWGDEALLEADGSGWTAGSFLKPDANGLGVETSTTGDIAGALALETTAASEKGRVRVMQPHQLT